MPASVGGVPVKLGKDHKRFRQTLRFEVTRFCAMAFVEHDVQLSQRSGQVTHDHDVQGRSLTLVCTVPLAANRDQSLHSCSLRGAPSCLPPPVDADSPGKVKPHSSEHV